MKSILVLAALTVVLQPASARSDAPRPTAAEAKAFVEKAAAELRELSIRRETADWIAQTHITDDTERVLAWASETLMEATTRAIQGSLRFRGTETDADTARMLALLRTGPTLPAPVDAAKRSELALFAARIAGLYGKSKWCGADGKASCRDLGQLEEVVSKSRNWDELIDAWSGWHTISRPMRSEYQRLAALGNEGAREIGFGDIYSPNCAQKSQRAVLTLSAIRKDAESSTRWLSLAGSNGVQAGDPAAAGVPVAARLPQ